MQNYGEELMVNSLMALADSCPRQLLKTLSSVVFLMLQSCRQAANKWFMTVIGRPDFPAATGGGAAAAVLTEHDRNTICMIALKEPSLPQARFEAFMTDVAAMCRREANSDILVAHQM
jgi:hypothetical protein